MKRVVVTPNPYRDKNFGTVRAARDILQNAGFDVKICLPFEIERTADMPKDIRFHRLDRELPGAFMVICFGGDGTILHMAKAATRFGIPILGVNIGTMGFMAELESTELSQLERVAKGDYTVDNRMMLDVTVHRDRDIIFHDICLNDVVVTKGAVARIVHLRVSCDDVEVMECGGDGIIVLDGVEYPVNYKDGIYVGMGTKELIFKSVDKENPAKFYINSCPAHRTCPTVHIPMDKARYNHLGGQATVNERILRQYIHPAVCESCQLSMGMTALLPGNVWNTMPSHTHERRMEVYTYFEVPEDQVVFHMMGEPQETRHVVMKNFDAIISPSWSIHSGVGTSNYTFIWAMGGENQAFDDMDNIATPDLR